MNAMDPHEREEARPSASPGVLPPGTRPGQAEAMLRAILREEREWMAQGPEPRAERWLEAAVAEIASAITGRVEPAPADLHDVYTLLSDSDAPRELLLEMLTFARLQRQGAAAHDGLATPGH